jgi:hypothetical protein
VEWCVEILGVMEMVLLAVCGSSLFSVYSPLDSLSFPTRLKKYGRMRPTRPPTGNLVTVDISKHSPEDHTMGSLLINNVAVALTKPQPIMKYIVIVHIVWAIVQIHPSHPLRGVLGSMPRQSSQDQLINQVKYTVSTVTIINKIKPFTLSITK